MHLFQSLQTGFGKQWFLPVSWSSDSGGQSGTVHEWLALGVLGQPDAGPGFRDSPWKPVFMRIERVRT